MDKKTYNSLLKDSTLLASISEKRLEELVSSYPYSATLHLLRLKKAFHENRDNFHELLGKMSAFSPDRNTLYKALHHRQKQQGKQKDSQMSLVSDIVEQKVETDDLVNENQITQSVLEDQTNDNDQEVIESKASKIDDNRLTISDEKSEEYASSYEGDVILLPAQSVYRLVVKDSVRHTDVEDTGVQKEDYDDVTLTSMDDLLQSDSNEHREEKPYKLSRVPVFEEDFLDFLNKDDTSNKSLDEKNKKASEEEKNESEKDRSLQDNMTESQIDTDETSNHLLQNQSSFDELDMIFNLFDKRKSKSNKLDEDDELDDSWLQSNASKNDIISVSLAELFVEQGKINEAIDMYRKLSLKFPEKSRLFADEIDKLEQSDT